METDREFQEEFINIYKLQKCSWNNITERRSDDRFNTVEKKVHLI